jgi:hypothetical protein
VLTQRYGSTTLGSKKIPLTSYGETHWLNATEEAGGAPNYAEAAFTRWRPRTLIDNSKLCMQQTALLDWIEVSCTSSVESVSCERNESPHYGNVTHAVDPQVMVGESGWRCLDSKTFQETFSVFEISYTGQVLE